MGQPRFVQPSATSPKLVGRERALDIVDRALAATRAGSGTTLLVSGEAGIGKSRLARECAARFLAAEPDGLVLRGHAFEGDQALPFAPISDLLRQFALPLEPARLAEAFGPEGVELVKLVPELSGAAPELRASLTLDPEPERRRLVETFARFIIRLASANPVLAIVEDLHWSDDASLDVLLHLARRCDGWPVLLLLTFRDDESGPALQHLLASLDRERLATEARLTRLTAGEVDLLVRTVVGPRRPLRPDITRAIHELTDGNPFFIEEVLSALLGAEDALNQYGIWDRRDIRDLPIPRSVRDAVDRRVVRLSVSATEVLSMAAVSGQRFSFDVLQRLTGLDEQALLNALKESIAARLIVEESADTFAFRHALTREAVYGGLLARERRQVHRRIAEVVEQTAGAVRDEATVADLAYHYAEAEEWEPALFWARRAAERALALHAPRAAAEQLSRALRAIHELGSTPPTDLLRMRATAWSILGELDRARADFEAALESARRVGDDGEIWETLIGLGQLWSARDYSIAGDYYQQALALARQNDDEARTAHSLNWLGNWYANAERPREALPLHREALVILERLADRPGVATTVNLLATSSEHSGLISDAARYFERAVSLYRDLGDRVGLASCLSTLAVLRCPCWVYDQSVEGTGREAAARDSDEALQLVREVGWRAGESYALSAQSLRCSAAGETDIAIEAAQQALSIAEEIGHLQWRLVGHFCLALVYQILLDTERAGQHVAEALALAETIESAYWARMLSALQACLAIDVDDIEAARNQLGGAFKPDDAPFTLALQRVWRERIRLALAEGRPDQALALLDQLIDAGRHDDVLAMPQLAYLRGLALVALDRPDEAHLALQAACDGADAQGSPPLGWRAHVALGSLLNNKGERAAGRRHLQSAAQLVEELAQRAPADAAQRLRDRALSMFQSTAGVDATDPLTARERDVAAQVALGQTNREIADALFLSERTVETHVRNILGKLHFTSRAQIAAWVVEQRQLMPDQ